MKKIHTKLTPAQQKRMRKRYASQKQYEMALRALEEIFEGIDTSKPLKLTGWVKKYAGCIPMDSKDPYNEIWKGRIK